MKLYIKLLLIGFFLISCKTGHLDVVAELPTSLKEISAIEIINDSNMVWVIEDAGNSNHLYGLNAKGKIVKDIVIKNAENIDWEDLTSDFEGNMYIGDFGNNNKKRTTFTIYKITNVENIETSTDADLIHFTLPKGMNSADFESFFLYKDFFYVFSKSTKTCHLIKVPNTVGNHEATYVSNVKLKGKHHKVTSADISDDGKTVVLLNHDKLWELTGYLKDDFFSGNIKALKFEHKSQKEGVTFINDNQIFISDERTKHDGGYMYSFNLKP